MSALGFDLRGKEGSSPAAIKETSLSRRHMTRFILMCSRYQHPGFEAVINGTKIGNIINVHDVDIQSVSWGPVNAYRYGNFVLATLQIENNDQGKTKNFFLNPKNHNKPGHFKSVYATGKNKQGETIFDDNYTGIVYSPYIRIWSVGVLRHVRYSKRKYFEVKLILYNPVLLIQVRE